MTHRGSLNIIIVCLSALFILILLFFSVHVDIFSQEETQEQPSLNSLQQGMYTGIVLYQL